MSVNDQSGSTGMTTEKAMKSGEDSGSRYAVDGASRVRLRIFALACGASFLLYLHRYSWNVVGPKLQSDLSFSHTQVAFLFSLFYYTYSVGQIPSGIFIDRWGPHRLLSGMIVVWSLSLTVIAQSSQVFTIAMGRLIFGAAQAGCYPALAQVTRQWFPASIRTVCQGWIATTFGRSGGAMSPIILGVVLMGWLGLTWQSAVTLLGLVGLCYAILFWYLFRDSPEQHAAVNSAELAIIRESHADQTTSQAKISDGTLKPRLLLRHRSLRFFVLQQFLDAGSDVAFVALIGAYFLQARGLDVSATGWLASLPLWGGALGGIAGGWMNDQLIRSTGSRRWSRSVVGFSGKVIGCLTLLAVAGQSSSLGAALCLMTAKFFSDWSQPTTWGTCTDIGGRFSATVFSIINTAGTSGGILMPLVFGVLLDWFTKTTDQGTLVTQVTNWGPLFYLLSGMYLLSGLCWLMVDCTQKLDQE